MVSTTTALTSLFEETSILLLYSGSFICAITGIDSFGGFHLSLDRILKRLDMQLLLLWLFCLYLMTYGRIFPVHTQEDKFLLIEGLGYAAPPIMALFFILDVIRPLFSSFPLNVFDTYNHWPVWLSNKNMIYKKCMEKQSAG